MKKTIAKTAAFAMAVMLAGTAVTPLSAFALPNGAIAATSDESEAAMKEALKKVKQRITVPDKLSEFEYSTEKSNGTKGFLFTWTTPDDVENFEYLSVTIVGDIITSYCREGDKLFQSSETSFAKLSESEILQKGKEYLKQLNPQIAGLVEYEVDAIALHSELAQISFKRYENGIAVRNNGGGVVIDKNTGELANMELNWYGNGTFKDPAGIKTKSEIKDAFRKMCTLTPYYRISTDWTDKKKTARIVYEPSSVGEIDAFTGKYSSIWDDMEAAEGTYLHTVRTYMTNSEDAAAGAAADYDDDMGLFTDAELMKIQQDNKLITPEKAFEMLKKDKFAALTDDYETERYNMYIKKDLNGKETFILELKFKLKKGVTDFKGYKDIRVNINAETGEVTYINKYSQSAASRKKLDEAAAKKTADAVVNTYAKNVISEHKYSEDESQTFYTSNNNERYAASKQFVYDRYVNGICVTNDRITVTVDADGTVSSYSINYTEDVKFPSADGILTSDKAFDKLYKQLDFNRYYDGWITKDGKVNTYLLYKIDDFTLNAKTGRLCSYYGEAREKTVLPSEVKYADIKGIPQEKAILEMKKYGALLTYDNKFEPEKIVTEKEFADFIKTALNEYIWLYSDNGERRDKANDALTRETAAVIFTKPYDRYDLAKLKGIFKTPYSDVKSSDENVGAIAIAYAKGFFGKGDGKFDGSRKITRAEAVQLVYDYIEKLSENK